MRMHYRWTFFLVHLYVLLVLVFHIIHRAYAVWMVYQIVLYPNCLLLVQPKFLDFTLLNILSFNDVLECWRLMMN